MRARYFNMAGFADVDPEAFSAQFSGCGDNVSGGFDDFSTDVEAAAQALLGPPSFAPRVAGFSINPFFPLIPLPGGGGSKRKRRPRTRSGKPRTPSDQRQLDLAQQQPSIYPSPASPDSPFHTDPYAASDVALSLQQEFPELYPNPDPSAFNMLAGYPRRR